MNSLLTLFLNGLVQSLLFAAIVLALAHIARRRVTVRHGILLAGLVGLAVLPVLTVALKDRGIALVSLPWAAEEEESASATPAERRGETVPNAPAASDGELVQATTGPDRVTVVPPITELPATDAMSASGAAAAAPRRGVNAMFHWIVAVWCAGLLLAAYGMMRSNLLLHRMIRGTRPLGRDVESLVAREITGVLGKRKMPPVVCSASVSGPMVAGIFSPKVILPSQIVGRLSGEAMRDIVLHEVAHVIRRDQAILLLQRVVGALYWMNPLVHLLNRQLARAREQICDNYVLSIVEPVEYGETLLYVGQLLPSRPVLAGAVGMFNANWTLEDRIAGLLDRRRTIMTRLHPFQRFGIVLGVIALSLWMSLNRVGFTQTAKAKEAGPTGLEYVPEDASFAIGIRPAALLSDPRLADVAKQLRSNEGPRFPGFEFHDLDRVTLAMFLAADGEQRDSSAIVFRTRKPYDGKKVVKGLARRAQKKEANGVTYYHGEMQLGASQFVYLADDRTVVFARDEANFWKMVKAGAKGANGAAWAEAWKKSNKSHFAIVGNMTQLQEFLDKATAEIPEEAIGAFQPLWRSGENAAVSISLSKQFELSGIYVCKNAADAPKVQAAMQTGFALILKQMERQPRVQRPGAPAQIELLSAQLAGKLLRGLKINTNGRQVKLSATLAANETNALLAMTSKALASAKGAASRAQSANNLKQIGLAMHVYADTYGHFPPPYSLGPDGKTRHSWRVALLPYLGQQKLYKEYRQNEPWDSPHNKKLLERMPDVYRHPQSKAKAGVTSYFAVTGDETAFNGSKGIKFADIRDGLSNTILTVEATRDVPWTKPQDIPYVPTKALPKFGGYTTGGGYYAGFADGSVQFLNKSVLAKKVRALLTIDGGETIERN